MKSAAIFLCTALAVASVEQTPAPKESPTFRLWFIGHDIGQETDTLSADGQHLQSTFHFEDRGTPIDLTAALDLENGAPTHLVVKGRNYRLFRSDSEVTVANGRAHVRDLATQSDITLGNRAVFPIDNYAPIGVQEQLIKYWLAHGRPTEIVAPPSGVVRIESRGKSAADATAAGRTRTPPIERLAIDGVVWGRETAWIEADTGRLLAVMTWAGALPFQAFRAGFEAQHNAAAFFREAVADRVNDLKRLTTDTPALARDSFALVGARVITGHRSDPIERGTIVVRNGRIVSVGSAASISVPRGVPVIDVAGKTIIPGLWDSHAHASQIDWAPVYLASGVTTIRDMGGEEGFLIAIRDAIASGQALGPRYLVAGLIDGPGPRAFGAVTASTPDEARAIVQRYHAEHFEEMKIYIETPAALVPVITAEAHRLGMTVTGHLPAGLNWQSAVEQGYDGIAHMQLRGQPGSDQSKEQMAFFVRHHTAMDPTLSWNELSGRSMAQPLDALLPGAGGLPIPLKRMFDSMSGGNGGSQVNSARLIKDAYDAGLNIMAGTDKGVPGFSLQREIEIYVSGGLTPLQAIQTATILPARAMRLDKDLGTLEVGKRADLVVLDGNPLEAISNIRTARMVSAGGRLYDCNVLWRAAGFGRIVAANR